MIFGSEKGNAEMAAEIGAKHIPTVKQTANGAPLLNDMFAQAIQSSPDAHIFTFVNADIILMSDFQKAVDTVCARMHEFLIIGRRTNTPVDFAINFEDPGWERNLRHFTADKGKLFRTDALDYFVFTRNLYESIPPFALGRMVWDNWLVHTAVHLKRNRVVDASKVVLAVHQTHTYNHIAGANKDPYQGVDYENNLSLARANGGFGDGMTYSSLWVIDAQDPADPAAFCLRKRMKSSTTRTPGAKRTVVCIPSKLER